MYTLKENTGKETVEMRDVFMEGLIDLARQDTRIVYLDADLQLCIGGKRFEKEFPERTFDCGIQEANMVGVAAGLSAEGLVPFAHSFASFITRRVYDQVFISGAYAGQNIKLVGSDPGITAQINGGTHMPFEDAGIMRGIPEMTVVEPTDSVMLKSLLPQIASAYGCFYMRLTRKGSTGIYTSGSQFRIGEAAILRRGKDVTLVACGLCVSEALQAAKALQTEGIQAGVIDMFTLKPLDKKAIIEAARNSRAIVTCENHSYYNGLGSAVAEVLAETCPRPLIRVGIEDRFGQTGDLAFLKREYGLNAEAICAAAKKALALRCAIE